MSAQSESASSGIDLARVYRKRWPLVLLCCTACIGLAVLYNQYAEPKYESSVAVLVMKKNPAATSVSGGGQAGEIQSELVEDVLATHMEILGSAQVLSGAIGDRSLDQLPGVASELSEETSALDYLKDNLSIRRGGEGQARDAQVLSASFTHGDADEAETILGAIVESYQNFLAKTFQEVSSEALSLIEKARDEIAAELETEEQAYVDFRGDAPLVFSGKDTTNAYESRLIALVTERSQLELLKSMTRSRLDVVRRATRQEMAPAQRLALIDRNHVERVALMVSVVSGDTVSEAFQAAQPERSEAANAEFDRLVSLRTERGLLRNRFGESHPRVRDLGSAIDELESFLQESRPDDVEPLKKLSPDEVMEAYVRLLDSDLSDLDRRIREVDVMIDEANTVAKQLERVEVQDKMFSARLQRKQELYNAVLVPLRDLSTLASAQGEYITEIISPVSEPDQVWPSLAILGLLGTGLGFGGGTCLAVAAELTEKTFSSPSEVGAAIGLPVLGVTPKVRKPAGRREAAETGVGPMVLAYHSPASRDAEAVRGVRTALFFSNELEGSRVLQITSPTPSDGKSLTAANLAVSFAGAGKSVLLIDADLRKPSQQHNFPRAAATAGGEDRPHGVPRGLSEALVEAAELPDVIVDSGIENLSLLFAGTIPPNPAELLSMPRMQELLEVVRSRFDIVLVDTPPLLAVSDPLIVASKTDGVLFVAPLRKNQSDAIVNANRVLGQVKCNPLGIIVNDVCGRLKNGGAIYGYERYGDYGYSAQETSQPEAELAGV